MKTSKWLLLPLLLIALPSHGQTPVNSSLAYDGGNPTNQLLLSWEAIPGKQYNVLTTPTLGGPPWQLLNLTPLAASNNLVKFKQTNSASARFYKVVKLDTDPPELWRLSPGSNAIAVARQSPLKAYLRDETAIDPTSIVFNVGTNAPVTLADPRLAYANGVLTYTAGTYEFLGTNAQTVTASLAVSDTLGHRATNVWSFQLEVATILASNVVLIGTPSGVAAKSPASSGLTLFSTNGETYVFSYLGASSGLSTGQVVVSTDAKNPYKRRILTLSENAANHTVSLVTTQASLAECIQQGSFRITADSLQQNGSGAAAAKAAAANAVAQPISLDGIILYQNGPAEVKILRGQTTFDHHVEYGGNFNGGLSTFDLDISARMDLDLTLEGTLDDSGDFEPEAVSLLPDPIPLFVEGGFVGPVPFVVTALLDIKRGLKAHAEVDGTLSAGFTSTETLNFGSALRNGQWTNYQKRSSSSAWSVPVWQIEGSGFVQVYLAAKITLLLDLVVGGSAEVKPYVELDASVCVEAEHAGVDTADSRWCCSAKPGRRFLV